MRSHSRRRLHQAAIWGFLVRQRAGARLGSCSGSLLFHATGRPYQADQPPVDGDQPTDGASCLLIVAVQSTARRCSSPLQLLASAAGSRWALPPLSQQRVVAQRRASTRGTVPRATGGIGDRRAPRPGNQSGEPETRTSSPSRAVCHARTHVAASCRRSGRRQPQFTGSAALPWAVEGRRIGWAGAADTAARQVAASMHVGWRGGDHARASRA